METERIISESVKDIAAPVVSNIAKFGSTQYKKLLVSLEKGFTKYLTYSYGRYSKIKTLLYRDRPVDLKAHYVSSDFALGDEIVPGNGVCDEFIARKRNIVTGTAGSGKSVLLRRLFIDLVEARKGIIPVLIELRLLETPEGDFRVLPYILKVISDLDEALTMDQLHFALKKGKIALFLDGFDEIDFEKKDKYEQDILELSTKYPDAVIVVSSRPDECFFSWEQFHVFKALPFNQDQAVDLVQRIEYDQTVKNKFIEELQKGLYERHRDFLSNPLLLTMMLLTTSNWLKFQRKYTYSMNKRLTPYFINMMP